MMEIREPKYAWGMRVVALEALVNDGSYPDVPADELLVPQGGVGEIVNVGHHSEANLPVYMVEFDGGRVIGCFEEEIAPLAATAAAVATPGT